MTASTSMPEQSPVAEIFRMDRRASVRRLCDRRAVVWLEDWLDGSPEAETPPMEATVQNLSASGVGLLLPDELPLHTLLVIEPSERGHHTPLLVARVVHALPQADGWSHGCELSHHLSADELRNWLA